MSPNRPNAQSSGFSLTEVLVAVAVVALVAAVAIPTMTSRLSVGRGNAIAAELTSLGTGLRAFNTNIGTYPRNLADLSRTPGTPLSYCGTTIVPATIAKWRGPYISRFITADYIIDNSTIVNQTTYTAGPPAYLQITISSVAADVARAIEEAIDGPVTATSYTTGSFTYASPDGTYRIPVATC